MKWLIIHTHSVEIALARKESNNYQSEPCRTQYMQASTYHNSEVFVPLTKNIQQANNIIEMFVTDFTIVENHHIIFNQMEAVPHNKEVWIIFNKIQKLIRKLSFKTHINTSVPTGRTLNVLLVVLLLLIYIHGIKCQKTTFGTCKQNFITRYSPFYFSLLWRKRPLVPFIITN